MSRRSEAAVTAIVTAFDRPAAVVKTVQRLLACVPPPVEVLVHVDAGQSATADAVRSACPEARVILGPERVGPGGGRNRLMAEAVSPIVASFDDDSYPVDGDYFARLAELFDRFPAAAVLGAQIFHANEPMRPDVKNQSWVADFCGCACAYRRGAFAATGGYVPLATAYGMEEVDLALRLGAQGQRILESEWLRVFHDTNLAHHAAPGITAASIANIALLAFLRYPVSLWPVGVAQVAKRVYWLLGHGRRAGVVAGVMSMPWHLLRHRKYRSPLPAAAVRAYLRLRRSGGSAAPMAGS